MSTTENGRKLLGSRWYIHIGKLILCLCVAAWILDSLSAGGWESCLRIRDYSFRNEPSQEAALPDDTAWLQQGFLAKGDMLHHVSVYLGKTGGDLRVSILSADGKEIASALLPAADQEADAWNAVSGLQASGLTRGEQYTLRLSAENGTISAAVSAQADPSVFAGLETGSLQAADTSASDAKLAVGIGFTWRCLTPGGLAEFVLKLLICVILGLALWVSILRMPGLTAVFRQEGRQEGLPAALYFAGTFTLLRYPLEPARNEVQEFGRQIGQGLAANMDVGKRVGNFALWYLAFSVSFVLFYGLAKQILHNVKSQEGRRAAAFFQNLMILADCTLVLRCITFFSDEAADTAGNPFTCSAVMLTVLITAGYLVFHLDRKVSWHIYAGLQFTALCISLPVSICVVPEWEKGSVLLGVWMLLALSVTVLCSTGIVKAPDPALLVLPALIPLITSLYIELIHVLNQHRIFVAYPARFYTIGMAAYGAGMILCTAAVKILRKKTGKGHAEASCMLPVPAAMVFVFGTACLSIQIPLSNVYHLNLLESVNYSLPIHDFLNFGSIPLVEHYGGHMMTTVWEGILYGLINADPRWAFVSPYAGLLRPFLAVLFCYLVKEIWDADMAVPAALLFPFMGHWSYFGLGMLVCIAAVSYVKNTTYVRAALAWGALIWCSIYRLDLGFSFAAAFVCVMAAYVLVTKHTRILRQLGLTLAGWTAAGMGLWFALCALKGINPVSRLREFLAISLSNPNWAYAGLGDVGNAVFCWCYIIIPFCTALGLVFLTFSKSLRDRIGLCRWILLLMLGWAYFGNFSRGLVRHSLEEKLTETVIWTGYVFLAAFFSAWRKKPGLFLPVFLVLILGNTMFLQDKNFSAAPVAETAVVKPDSILDSWRPGRFSEEDVPAEGSDGGFRTMWEQIKTEGRRVPRVTLHEDLTDFRQSYMLLLGRLLEEDETFVDFINKTMLYPLLGKRDPVYVSQSPLQLSGEFSQEAFIREMEGVPIVLMPLDADNYIESNSSDGITNAYRYYLVSEYIYQNYEPLCRYEDEYAVWCARDRRDTFALRLKELLDTPDAAGLLAEHEGIGKGNVTLKKDPDGAVTMTAAGPDPSLTDLQSALDLSSWYGETVPVHVEYTTDTAGNLQLYYTTEPGEVFSEEKSVSEKIKGSGTATFWIPVTESARLRLDTPEGSSVQIRSLAVKLPADPIRYGYDGPTVDEKAEGGEAYLYISTLHHHTLDQLPRIWAEYDRKQAAENPVLAEPEAAAAGEGIYVFDPQTVDKTRGNYLLFTASCDGMDTEGRYRDEDELFPAAVVLGHYQDGAFAEKCRFDLTLKEGAHNYLIRCSTDYYWYSGDVNAVRLETAGPAPVYGISVKVLAGD